MDIYNSYKQDYFSDNGGGFSAIYNDEIKSFRDNLAYLDQALGETLLLHKKMIIGKERNKIPLSQVQERSQARPKCLPK